MEKTNNNQVNVANNVAIENGRGKKLHVEYNGQVYPSQNALRLELAISPSKFYKMLLAGEITRTEKESTISTTYSHGVFKINSAIPVSYKGKVYATQHALRMKLKISSTKFYEMLFNGEITRFVEENEEKEVA